jgi:chromosome partitioning protein
MDYPTILAFVGQKGGTGKTTSAVNVGAALSERGLRVLGIDLDPQGGMSRHLGVRAPDGARSIRAALTGDTPLINLVVQTRSGLLLAPSHPSLATLGVEVTSYAEQRLSTALRPLADLPEDRRIHFVLVDCPPSLDLLPLNAIHAAHGVVIPVCPEVLPAATLPAVLGTVNDVRVLGRRADLRILGVLPCQVRRRTRLAQAIGELLPRLAPGVPVLPPIRRSVKVAEAPGNHLPLLQYAPAHPAADDYRRATEALLHSIDAPAAGIPAPRCEAVEGRRA